MFINVTNLSELHLAGTEIGAKANLQHHHIFRKAMQRTDEVN
jgi:hypothetical protein